MAALVNPFEELLLVNQESAAKVPYDPVKPVPMSVKQQLANGLFLEGRGALAQLLNGDEDA